MRYKLHSTFSIYFIFIVIGVFAFNLPMAEAADIEATIPQLELSLSEEVADPIPGAEVTVDLLVDEGSFTTGDGVNAIQFTIGFDSTVVTVAEPVVDNINIHASEFGIELDPGVKWSYDADILPGGEQLVITMNNHELWAGFLQEPQSGWPGRLLTIWFTVQSFQQGAVTDVVFLEGSSETFFQTLLDKFTISSAASGRITLRESGSTAVLLSLPSVGAPPIPGSDVPPINLSVHGGYQDIDLIDAVVLTIAYDSTIVEMANDPPVSGTDVVTHLDQFGVTEGWQVILPETIKGPVPGHPELDRQLVIQMANTNPDQFPALGAVSPPALSAVSPGDLLTINFKVVGDQPALATRLIFIDESNSYFQKRDQSVSLGKLPVDLSYDPPGTEPDPHGDVKLPVILSALGAIWHPNGAKIFWEAESQQGNLGWNIYRSETKEGKFVKINGKLIKGAGTTANPMKYSFIDKDAEKGKVYYYYLEDISFSGEKHRTDPTKSIPVSKNISWGDIKRSALR
jgi:hypothetical protein